MMFTIEEISLIQAMNHTSRRMVVIDIKAHYPYIEDDELKELCARTLRKLDKMTDEEFAATDFAIYEEDGQESDI